MPNPRDGKGHSLGLAVGATNLAGTGEGQRSVLRPATVTLDGGLTLTGFVDRVGDPVPMVGQDGSRHRPEMLLVEALDGVARAAAMAPVSEVAVAVPAHWRPNMTDALREAMQSKPGLARSPLVPDATAALTALRSNPGLPTSGVIVLCDFGGSGTSITLADAAAKDAPIGGTVRVPDFSGDQIDQAILTEVVADLFASPDADPAGTSMVNSLTTLREECRRGKERLSDETATAIVVDIPGMATTVRLTRVELEAMIDAPLNGFLAALADTLDRNRIPLASISAVATVGGGARIPLITQRLSAALRTSVITTPQPQLTAAEGVALIAHRSRFVETATTVAPAAPATATVAAASIAAAAPAAVGGALAWSEVDNDPYDVMHTEPYFDEQQPVSAPADGRPEVAFRHDEPHEWEEPTPARRRAPAVLAGLAAAAVVVAGTVFGLTAISRDTTTVPAGTSSSIAPAAPAPAAEPQAPAAAVAPAPAPTVTTVVARPQPRYVPQQQQQAPAAHPAPEAPAPEAPAPAPEPEPAPEPAPPAPENPAPPTDPGTGTPPTDPGSGGSGGTGGTGTPPIDPGTGGSGGTGTPPIDPGTGGSGGTGTGSGSGAGPGTGGETGTGGQLNAPAKPGLIGPILEPILTPKS